MRTILFILILACISLSTFGEEVKWKLEKTPASSLPFARTKAALWGKPGYAIAWDERSNLPIYTYKDLCLTQRNDFDEDVVIFRKFQPTNTNFYIAALTIGVSDPNRELLVTYDKEGKVIDFLESGVFCMNSSWLFIKQWRITEKLEVIITTIKVNPADNIDASDKFISVRGYRVDTYYKIDTSGKFLKEKEVKYEPTMYSKSYLEDKNKNLWEGEEKIQEE